MDQDILNRQYVIVPTPKKDHSLAAITIAIIALVIAGVVLGGLFFTKGTTQSQGNNGDVLTAIALLDEHSNPTKTVTPQPTSTPSPTATKNITPIVVALTSTPVYPYCHQDTTRDYELCLPVPTATLIPTATAVTTPHVCRDEDVAHAPEPCLKAPVVVTAVPPTPNITQ